MASEKKTETVPQKTTYEEPTLTGYGQLKDLTAGGTGKSNENSMGKKPRA